MDRTPSSRSSSIRILNQLPLSSTMLNKSLPLRISAETTDSGLASTNCTQFVSGSENSFKISEEKQNEDLCHHHYGGSSTNKNNQTPHSGFMLLRRNLASRGSSTPKRCVSHCPFPTPDRLNESFISHEVFENQLLAIQEKSSFSPCIDWQSTMNPTAFDTSDPAAYLPPVRSQSAEQRYETAINAFFRKKIVPSPTPSIARRRPTLYPTGQHDSTIELKSPVFVPSKGNSIRTQTEVTIPPNCDLDELLAPFSTFTENDTHVSLMEMSRSSSSSSTSTSSLSRRKLFSEDDIENHFDSNSSTSVVVHKYNSFDETVARSPPPEICGVEGAVNNGLSAWNDKAPVIDSFRYENLHVADIEEIPRGSLEIDLSPIRPQNMAESTTTSTSSIVPDCQDGRSMDDIINMSIV